MRTRGAASRNWLAFVAGLALSAPTAGQLNGSLFDDPAYETDDVPVDVVATDLDGDARIDLITSCGGSHTIRVLFGAGDGSFPESKSSDVPSAVWIVPDDFDEDGMLDLATLSFSGKQIVPLLGDGTGGFAPSPPIVLQDAPVSLEGADFNLDGHADLVTTHSYPSLTPGSVEVFLGNGDATFVSQPTLDVGHSPMAIAVADFDTDGQPDLAVVNDGDASLSILLGQGDGSFSRLSPLVIGTGGGAGGADRIAVGDFSEDGQPDLGVYGFVDGASYVGLSILLGAGDGTFVKDSFHVLLGGPYAVDDFNEDGHVDLACSTSNPGQGTMLLGTGAGDFVSGGHFDNGGYPIAALVNADYDGDGHVDLAACNQWQDRVAIRFGKGDGTFPNVNNPPVQTDAEASCVTTGDLDGDGLQDAVVANTAGKVITSYVGQAGGTLQKFGAFGFGEQLSAVALADFNGDGELDAVTTSNKTDKASVMLGLGTGGFSLPTSYAVGDEPLSVAVGDFNGDGRADVVAANHGGNLVSVLLGHGNGGLSQASTISAGFKPVFVAVGNFDADSSQDLAVVNEGDMVSILGGNGAGGFALQTSIPVASGPTSVAVADVDADGWQDLLVGHDAESHVSLLLGSAAGLVAGGSLATGTRPLAVAASDIDGNGTVDVATANGASGTVSVLLGAGDGAFQLNGNFVCADSQQQPRAIAIGDFDNDGRPDVVVVTTSEPYLDSTIVVLRNKGPSAWTDLGLALPGSLQAPHLAGNGPLDSSSSDSIELTYAKPGASTWLVAGLDSVSLPLKGGTLVPMPQVLVPFHVPPTGAFELPFHLPPSIPAALTLYAQAWILDDQGPAGWAATNGLLGVTP